MGQQSQAVKELRESIEEELRALKQVVILVCGGTGHGKSSLIDNCMAALRGSYCPNARFCNGQEQITKQYKQFQSYTMDDGVERKLPLMFADTRGFSESETEGASVAAIQACIMGKVANGETIDPSITDEEWLKKKEMNLKASYIFFVADATIIGKKPTFDQQRQTLINNLREICKFAKAKDIQVSVFVTKCDNLDPDVKYSPSDLHSSKAVQDAVTEFSSMIDVQGNRVFPVVNYTEQLNRNNEMMKQTLLSLKYCMEDILVDRYL